MKLIQNKLCTPSSSAERLDHNERTPSDPGRPETKTNDSAPHPVSEKSQKPAVPEKVYKYRGPPSVNMGTWSERPKVPVSVKEDADYKLSNNVSSRLIVNTTNNNVSSSNSVEVNSYGRNFPVNGYEREESHKVNGTEPVVIKIGASNSKPVDSQRLINHTTATGYRKPFSNMNKNQPTARPHSVAFDSDFDISRVPVVRSVELKKPFKNNTSVTHINQETEPVSELHNKFSTKYKSSENLYNGYLNHEVKEPRPVFRVNSFKPNIAPTVRGFKTVDSSNVSNRLSWNPPNYNTLPAKPKETSYSTNRDVPFSQSNLRRTESKLEKNEGNTEKKTNGYVEMNNEKNSTYNSLPSVTKDVIRPPPPPLMPKTSLRKPVAKPVLEVDARDQLLSAIRNFGGKKGLKAVKA